MNRQASSGAAEVLKLTSVRFNQFIPVNISITFRRKKQKLDMAQQCSNEKKLQESTEGSSSTDQNLSEAIKSMKGAFTPPYWDGWKKDRSADFPLCWLENNNVQQSMKNVILAMYDKIVQLEKRKMSGHDQDESESEGDGVDVVTNFEDHTNDESLQETPNCSNNKSDKDSINKSNISLASMIDGVIETIDSLAIEVGKVQSKK